MIDQQKAEEDDEPGAPIADFFHRYSIRREMALYHRSSRPIHALRAYYWIRQAGLPPPPWFLEYLDQVAERMTKIAPGNGDDVAEAFGMGATGRHSVECRRLEAAQMVAILRDMHPDEPLDDPTNDRASPKRRVFSARRKTSLAYPSHSSRRPTTTGV